MRRACSADPLHSVRVRYWGFLRGYAKTPDSDKAMEVQSNEKAALLKLLKSKSRTKTELLKVSSARRRARQAALDALLAEGKVIRIDKEYFANDPSGSVEQLIHAEAVRLDAYLRSVPDALARSTVGSSLAKNPWVARCRM